MVPEDEHPVLEQLIHIRNRLTALKKDRTEYIRAKDVLEIYAALMNQVTRLNDIRAQPKPSTSTDESEDKSADENRVDTILNDVFQLLSLFFLRIGKSREAPATFCQLGTMKRLLTHLNESGIYTEADLKPYQARLAELKEIIEEGAHKADEAADAQEKQRDEAMTKLLLAKWDICDRLVSKLSSSLSQLSTELYPLHQRLITLRRSLASIAARPRPQSSDVAPILSELRQIEEKRASSPSGSKFAVESPPGSGEFVEPPLGQELLAGLLEDNFNIVEEIQARQGEEQVSRGPLQAIYDRLSEIRAQLERLVLTHRWTLRETDLYNYQNELARVDALRVDGKFRDADGNVPDGQLVLLYLLRRCYGLCYRLMASSEPVSEELMPIANKLNTIKRCLIEVAKQGGPFTARDLYPFQLALYQLDSLRKDGKFEGRDGSIPEGQAILNALLSEAHEMVSYLQEMEE
ncbi:hypothetical protein JCM10207_004258 [Rhodosporidiobolus poonsookiae]